jgi:hypothetical protein
VREHYLFRSIEFVGHVDGAHDLWCSSGFRSWQGRRSEDSGLTLGKSLQQRESVPTGDRVDDQAVIARNAGSATNALPDYRDVVRLNLS